MDIIKTLDGLIKDVNNNHIDTLDELQRELIYLKDELETINYSSCCKSDNNLLKCSGCNKPLKAGLCGSCCSDLANDNY